MYFRLHFQTHAYVIHYLFIDIKTDIFKLIKMVLVDLRFNIFMWFLFRSYFIIFFQDNLIHCMINNSIVLLMYLKFIFVRGIIPTVLSNPAFSILGNKVSQDVELIWWMTGAMYETSFFVYILWMICIFFMCLPALSLISEYLIEEVASLLIFLL